MGKEASKGPKADKLKGQLYGTVPAIHFVVTASVPLRFFLASGLQIVLDFPCFHPNCSSVPTSHYAVL